MEAAPIRPAEPRVREIKRLLLAMARDWELDGYRIRAGDGGIVSAPGSGMRRELLSAYVGLDMRGEVWLVSNIGEEPLKLDAFPHSGVAVAASESREIKPGEEARLYLVRGAGLAEDL